MRILEYRRGSKGATALAKALNTKKVSREDSAFRNNYNHCIVNWGCSSFDGSFPVNNWVNSPDAVARASNKLSAFRALHEVIPDNLPPFTTSESEAQSWHLDGKGVVCRFKLTGHSGDGIEITDVTSDGVVIDVTSFTSRYGKPAPLYVQYIKKIEEYRAHVVNGEVIDVQQKRKRSAVENNLVDYRVRNSHNGWVYCRDNVTYGDELTRIAIASVRGLGLDFGAVDIIFNKKRNKYYVLEVNTACGVEGTTVTNYATHIRNLVRQRGLK